MDILVLAGVGVTLLGLAGLIYCIAKAFKARQAGLEGEELSTHLQSLVAINVGSFALSALGLALVIVGILL
ncbi:hypothetical protein GCM10007939_12280 [Amylibacter marinus]|uniref:Uncharacterized protein n=1 Tax=Amylibacter marinus TaxID=1475483 RepID=A0ABQ5VUJ5_9RHOB|nr:hypothetical protein [Amylibacter marinus]GLQ34945.1 hypothetical protein GCM10007939_12280 [Amylibacter marinus]